MNAKASLSALDRFWAKVDKNGPIPAHRPDLGSCWLWLAQISDLGYGLFWPGPGSHQTMPAHKWAYERWVGPVPDGLEMDHLCRVRHCVNFQHVEPVTHQENCRRAALARTHCQNGHELPPVSTAQADSTLIRPCPVCREGALRRGREKYHARQVAKRQMTPIPLQTRWYTGVFARATALDWSDAELAKAMGISPTLVCRIRRGERPPSVKFLVGALRAFPDVSPDELLWGEPPLAMPPIHERFQKSRGRGSRKVSIGVNLDPQVLMVVKQMAQAQRVTLSKLVRTAIYAYVNPQRDNEVPA